MLGTQQKIAGHTTKYPFAQAAVSISAGNDHVGPLFPGNRVQQACVVTD
jgi:hypothetical protein